MYTTLYRVQNRIQNTITYEYMSIVAVTTNAHTLPPLQRRGPNRIPGGVCDTPSAAE